MELYDVSPVTFPAYTSTSTGFRAEGDVNEAKRSYEAWQARRYAADAESYYRRAKAVNVAMKMQEA